MPPRSSMILRWSNMYTNVHNDCTLVNVDCVSRVLDNVRVIEGRTTGQILRGLMERAGLSVRAFAQAAGYSHGSGVQRYIEADYDSELPNQVARKMAEALDGRGEPPITRAEVFLLTGVVPHFEAQPNDVLPPRYVDLPRDVPIFGTAVGTFSEDENIEQTAMEMGEPIDHMIRPPGLMGKRGIYGLYVVGESQMDRFKPGELVFADPNRPPMIGDDVIVYLKKQQGDDEAIASILIKQLIRRGPSRIELRQLNPFAEFSVDARKVAAIHRVLTSTDLWGGYR